MKKIFLLALFGVLIIQSSQAQIKLNAVVGGGMSDMKQYFNESEQIKFEPAILVNAGITASTKFRKDGMLSIELGALLSYSGFKNIDIDWEATTAGQNGFSKFIWKDDSYTPIRSFFLKIPMTFDFNVYERMGLLAGAHLNLRLSNNEELEALRAAQGTENSKAKFEKLAPGIHLGFYGDITNRIRVDAKVFTDFKPRLHNAGFVDKLSYRELGFSLNLNYRLNP